MPSLNFRRTWLQLASVCMLFASTALSTGVTPFLQQSFFFDWNVDGQPLPIPITEQCETIHIKWSRAAATGPNPTAPYYLQVYASTSLTPFVITAGDALNYDWAVPFPPGTQYQICMFDKFGNTGGCQGMYTVIPARTTTAPSCTNVTYPPLLDIQGLVSNGPLSRYGWVDQCSDISITPKNGTAPYTLTVAPALHPPYNITSPSSGAINWTVSMDWASPFFLSLVDADGNMWANGPIHAGGGGTTGCLSGSGTTAAGKTVKPAVAVGSGLGGLVVGLAIGILGAWLFSRKQYRKKLDSARFPDSGPGSPQALLYEQGGTSQYRPVPTTSSSGILSTNPSTMAHQRSMGYQVEPFQMPDEEGRIHGAVGPASPGSAYAPSLTGNRMSTVGHETNFTHQPATRPSTSASGGGAGANQVYVVHHDSQTPPVTIYHRDGTQIVELPPRYPPMSSPPSEMMNEARSASDSRSDGSRTDGPESLVLHQPRQPGTVRKPGRAPQ